MSRILRNKKENEEKIGRKGTKSDVFTIASNYIGRKRKQNRNKNRVVDSKTKNSVGTIICQSEGFI